MYSDVVNNSLLRNTADVDINMYKVETLLIVPTLVIEYFFIPFLPEVVGKGKFPNMLQREKKKKKKKG